MVCCMGSCSITVTDVDNMLACLFCPAYTGASGLCSAFFSADSVLLLLLLQVHWHRRAAADCPSWPVVPDRHV
jgi:hypothetical protein